MPRNQPISVMLGEEFRKRLEREAERRELKLSTVLRILADERLRELADSERLSAAEEWQRAQAWESWEQYRRGENPEATWKEVDAAFDKALAPEAKPPSSPRRASSRTSKRKLPG